jgi:hypothetical protein
VPPYKTVPHGCRKKHGIEPTDKIYPDQSPERAFQTGGPHEESELLSEDEGVEKGKKEGAKIESRIDGPECSREGGPVNPEEQVGKKEKGYGDLEEGFIIH